MNMIGQLVAHRALSERRNIVIELIGADAKPTLQLVEALKTIGYVPKGVAVTCEFEEAHRRNLARSGDNISAYYAEPFHHAWIIDACREQQVLRKVDQVSCMSSKPRPKDPVVQGLSSTETRAVPRSYPRYRTLRG